MNSTTIKHRIYKKEVYPTIDVHMPTEEVEVEVTYTPIGIVRSPLKSGDETVVVFETSIEGCNLTGTYRFTFFYEGKDDLYKEAINALESFFNQGS